MPQPALDQIVNQYTGLLSLLENLQERAVQGEDVRQVVERLLTLGPSASADSAIGSLPIPPLPQALRDIDAAVPESQVPDVLRRIDEMRLRMTAVLLSARLRGAAPDVAKLLSPDVNEDGAFGAVVYARSGTAYSFIEGRCVIVLPVLRAVSERDLVLSDLLEIYDVSGSAKGWVIDCSALTDFPLFLQAVLLGYKNSLNQHQKDFALVWVKPSAVPERHRASFSKAFGITKAGDYFFSTES